MCPQLNTFPFPRKKLESPKLLKGILKLFPFEFDLYFNTSFELVRLNFRLYLAYPKKEIILPHPSLKNIFSICLKELRNFFECKSPFLNLPHHLTLKPSSLKILEFLRDIPKGKTITYGELAERVGLPKGQRAVAKILASNPLPLLYPCHRVISKRGISGYSQGVFLKWLLLFWETKYQISDSNS